MIDIIVPCRNEELHVEQFLNSLFKQTLINKVESIFIADGISDDQTLLIIDKFKNNHEYGRKIKLINNKDRTTPAGLNAAIALSKSEYICRLDVHSNYPENYLERLYYTITNSDFDCVGARWNIQPSTSSFTARAIAAALKSPLAVGNVPYKSESDNHKQKVMEAKAVPYGFYHRSVFNKIGYFDTDLTKNQDNEFYDRMLIANLKIGLLNDIELIYYSRPSFLSLAYNYYGYGRFTPLVDWKKKKLSYRRLSPLVASLIFCFCAYQSLSMAMVLVTMYILLIALYGIKRKVQLNLIMHYIMAHFTIHTAFLFGYLKGVINVILR